MLFWFMISDSTIPKAPINVTIEVFSLSKAPIIPWTKPPFKLSPPLLGSRQTFQWLKIQTDKLQIH